MCLSCSMFCGRCRPALYVAVVCPSCGETNEVSREECIQTLGYRARGVGKVHEGHAARCTKCGENLRDCIAKAVKPLDCVRSGIVCGYPCGRHWKEFGTGDLPCEKQVPLGKIGTMAEATANTKAMARVKRRHMTKIEK